MITFSPPPPPPDPRSVPAVLPAPDAPPRRPGPPPLPGSALQGANQGGSALAPRPSGRPIEGTPVRAELSQPPSSGPKPPRRSINAPPADAPSVAPDLDFGSAPRISLEPPGTNLGAIVAGGDFFPSSPDIAGNANQPVAAEAFARGSAIETADRSPLLIDVTPLSLRVETVGGYSDVLIAANSPVPCEKARTFLTASDNQTVVFIRVAQGESSRFAENTRLGELELSGLKPTTRGQVKILVTFELDADGILNVHAKDKDTNRETTAAMRVMGASTDQAEVDAMVARQARHEVA